MRITTLCSAVCGVLMLALTACNNEHFISDAEERAAVENDFQARRQQFPDGDLFRIFDQDMTQVQREAMTFLYAYMPLVDIADQSGEYFLENINYALKAREEMPWGKQIPEREFRHFVLPLRINNENLDDSRKVFYEELKDRVKGLSLHDAVIEVNHWCHEKVVYTPTDSRTSSPLASVKTAFGRCGEESTFTVAAMRAVGIPARQVYTPRWAHTDDNHAWVEAWVDGKWFFLGACEPEPVLNLGWFNAPASRGMLMHTKVFGNYFGPEEVMYRTPIFTEINIMENYGPTAKVDFRVVDTEGKAVDDALVEFKVYNYGEFYSVAKKHTDAEGKTSLAAGKGDMLVWASKEGRFGYQHVSFGKDTQLEVVLDKKAGDSYAVDFDIVPPVEGSNLPPVTAQQRKENTRKMAQEDSIRHAYEATFYNKEKAAEFAKLYQLDEEKVVSLLVKSRGNHEVIKDFMARLRSEKSKKGGLDLLSRISTKDLRDVTKDVLLDHMANSKVFCAKELFCEYVRNPRIKNELLTPYKHFFQKVLSEEEQKMYREEPTKLAQWVATNIKVDANCNLGASPISPEGVWKARVADAQSRDIFFVAMARSMGIPARIDEVTGKVQVFISKTEAVDIDFGAAAPAVAKTGTLMANYKAKKSLLDPKYYAHFTISKITEVGTLQLLNYEEGEIDMGSGVTWSNLLKNGLSLEEGNYALVSGTRLASGTVLARTVFFTIEAGKTTDVELIFRENNDGVKVIGSFNSESKYKPVGGKALKSILETTGRGYYCVAVLGSGQEPTNHALRDIAALGKEFEKWGRKLVLLFPDEANYKKFRPQDFEGLPNTIVWGIDTDGSIQQQIYKNMKLSNNTILPMFIIGDTFNRVVFVSQGYTIGLGEQMMKVIHKL